MRIAAFLDARTARVLSHSLAAGHVVERLEDAADAERAVRSGRFDALVVDPGVLTDSDLDFLSFAFAQRATPVLLLAELSAGSARIMLRIAELGVHEIVLVGEGDPAGLLARRLAAVREHSVPAQVLSRAAGRVRLFPDRLQTTLVSLFGNGELPRWVNGLARRSGLPRRSLDRWMARAGLDGAACLLEVARMSRVWEPLVEQRFPLRTVAEQCGYPNPRLLIAHARRLVRVAPDEIRDHYTRREFSERLSEQLLAAGGR